MSCVYIIICLYKVDLYKNYIYWYIIVLIFIYNTEQKLDNNKIGSVTLPKSKQNQMNSQNM